MGAAVVNSTRFAERIVRVGTKAQVSVREAGPRGDAPTLVLLHGISSAAQSWQAPVALLEGAHVIAWDAPGYGRSTPLAQAVPTAADYAQRLQDLLLALGVQRCVLVGHSLGALMACAYAAREDKVEVDRVILVSPARGYGDDAAAAERVRRERTEALHKKGVSGLAAAIDQRLLSSGATPAARQAVRGTAAQLQPEGYLQAVEMLCNSTLARVPAGTPVEVHCGEHDVVTTPAASRAAAEALGASYQAIAAAGHASPVEQPQAIAAILRAAAR